jgi:hypothetical protein
MVSAPSAIATAARSSCEALREGQHVASRIRSKPGRTVTGMKSRNAVLTIVLFVFALSVPSLAAARPTRHRQPPSVRCVGGACVTHFLVEITGSQQTNWRFPFQRVGAADCYRVPYASGDGAQRIQFDGTGLVEATRIGRGAATFEYLRQGRVRSGIGAGAAHIARYASWVSKVDPGPCGATTDVGTYQKFHGCGQTGQKWTYELEASSANRVALDAGTELGSLVPGFSSSCPVLWSGLPGGAPADGLYIGLTGRLPASELFDQSVGKITLAAHHVFAEKDVYSPLGITGQTAVQWTVTFTRLSHDGFPVEAAPLMRQAGKPSG